MQKFTGWQYLLIDAANNYGLDKEVYETRIKWAEDNLESLEEMAEYADDIPRFTKSVMAIRRALRGEPIGHLVGFDAICSGMQLMSCMTGCIHGARATGLIEPNMRADAYTAVTDAMNTLLTSGVNVSRQDAKDAVMKSLYGSKREPKNIFGEDTPELEAFYKALMLVAPGASTLLGVLLESWQPYALVHEWLLPDCGHARVKVTDDFTARIEVDALDHATFTYVWSENVGLKKGLSNVANVTHSVDAYVLRSVHRRCNYDVAMVNRAEALLNARSQYAASTPRSNDPIIEYVDRYTRTQMIDTALLNHITADNVAYLTSEHTSELLRVITEMKQYKPFEVVTVHDEFQCHPNNMNYLRQTYNNILADLADSVVIQDILNQIHGSNGTYTKAIPDLSKYIRNANYSLS